MAAPNDKEIRRWGLLFLLLRLAVLILILLLPLRRTTARVPGPADVTALYQSRPHGGRHDALLLCCTCYHWNECSNRAGCVGACIMSCG